MAIRVPRTSGAQIKAARVLLGWDMRVLASRALVKIKDVRAIEETRDSVTTRYDEVTALRNALKKEGIKFIGTLGVQIRPNNSKRNEDHPELKIMTFLKRNRGKPFCDDCIGSKLSLCAKDVIYFTEKLRRQEQLVPTSTICMGCGGSAPGTRAV
jgi:hypothetical protein